MQSPQSTQQHTLFSEGLRWHVSLEKVPPLHLGPTPLGRGVICLKKTKHCTFLQILPAVVNFKPDMIFVSAGFDGHKKVGSPLLCVPCY